MSGNARRSQRTAAGRLLRVNAAFRALWAARSISYLGDSVALVALLVHVQGQTGAALAVAALLLAGDCVPGLVAPLVGALADRAHPRRILVGGELIQGGLMLVTATLPPLPILLLLIAAQGLVGAAVQATARAAVPRHVPDADLEAANAALGAGSYGLEAAGPLLAAAVLQAVGVRGVLILDAATFAVGALLLLRLPPVPPPAPTARSLLPEARAGLGYLWAEPILRRVTLGFLMVVVFSGVDDVALVFLVKDELAGSDAAAAAVYAGAGIGLIIGYLALGSGRGSVIPGLVLFVAGLAVSSAGNLLTGLAGTVAVAMVWQTLRGVGVAALDVALNTHVQRNVPASWQGRVFSNLYGGAGFAAGVSYLAGGLILDLTSARVAFLTAGAGGLVAALATGVSLWLAGPSRRDPPKSRPGP